MQQREEILQALRDSFPYLAAEYSVKRIGLFGSFARGTGGQDSDIDIVVEFERPVGFKFVQLVEYLESLLGRDVDLLTPAGIEGIRVEGVAREINSSVVYV